MKSSILTIFLILLIIQIVHSIKWGPCLICGIVCAVVSGANGKYSEDACKPCIKDYCKKK